jgi:hypothetical protein
MVDQGGQDHLTFDMQMGDILLVRRKVGEPDAHRLINV